MTAEFPEAVKWANLLGSAIEKNEKIHAKSSASGHEYSIESGYGKKMSIADIVKKSAEVIKELNGKEDQPDVQKLKQDITSLTEKIIQKRVDKDNRPRYKMFRAAALLCSIATIPLGIGLGGLYALYKSRMNFHDDIQTLKAQIGKRQPAAEILKQSPQILKTPKSKWKDVTFRLNNTGAKHSTSPDLKYSVNIKDGEKHGVISISDKEKSKLSEFEQKKVGDREKIEKQWMARLNNTLSSAMISTIVEDVNTNYQEHLSLKELGNASFQPTQDDIQFDVAIVRNKGGDIIEIKVRALIAYEEQHGMEGVPKDKLYANVSFSIKESLDSIKNIEKKTFQATNFQRDFISKAEYRKVTRNIELGKLDQFGPEKKQEFITNYNGMQSNFNPVFQILSGKEIDLTKIDDNLRLGLEFTHDQVQKRKNRDLKDVLSSIQNGGSSFEVDAQRGLFDVTVIDQGREVKASSHERGPEKYKEYNDYFKQLTNGQPLWDEILRKLFGQGTLADSHGTLDLAMNVVMQSYTIDIGNKDAIFKAIQDGVGFPCKLEVLRDEKNGKIINCNIEIDYRVSMVAIEFQDLLAKMDPDSIGVKINLSIDWDETSKTFALSKYEYSFENNTSPITSS